MSEMIERVAWRAIRWMIIAIAIVYAVAFPIASLCGAIILFRIATGLW